LYKTRYFIIFLCAFLSLSCSDKNRSQQLSDEEFFASISNENFRESIQKINSLIELDEHSNYRRAILFHEKGRLLGQLNKDIEAIASLKEALRLFDKEADTKLIAKTNLLLGDSYATINYKQGEAKALNSLGHLSFITGDFSTSADNVKKAIAIQEELNDKEMLSASYNNLGYILEQTEDYDQAIVYYKKAISLNKESNRQDSNALRNLGYVYLLKNDLKQCKLIYKEALAIEEKAEKYGIQKEIYDVLIETSLKDKDIASLSRYISKKDSVSQLLSSYEDAEKAKLINTKYKQFITQENLKQELALNKKNKFILGSVLGLLLALGLYIFQKNRNSRLQLKQQKLELEQKMLRLQMNPHFVFNTLTAIQNKVFDNEPLELMTYISKFAKLIRQNFDFVNKEEITLAEDLDALTNYIETQQFRFNNRFNYTINIDKDIDTSYIKIPPMLLQIFVENAIEHGLKPKENQGELTINIGTEKGFIKFEIIDDGIGYTKKELTEEHAIDIFKKRLTLRQLGEEKLFSIQSLGTNLGTKVAFSLNLAS